MENVRTLNRTFGQLTWGAIFIWWGVTELFKFLPDGTGALGFGLILIGANVARSLNGIPMSSFSVTVGILAIVLGVLELAGVFLALPFELPIFSILLIVFGLIVLAQGITGVGREQNV